MDLATAYVQIVPSTKGIKGKLQDALGNEASSAGTSSGESFGSAMVSKIKGVVAAAGIGAIFKEAISAGADLEQSFGGLDTIYGDAADAAKQYAQEAAKAGISANDYAEQAVGFGASLKMAFGGDTAKAVEAANTAIMDMTDNAAKMGTPLESIQNAYSGFAKQNYTMLDNLKLGYGGTKEEMQRLLTDAEKLSGVKYDMSNLGDVYDAIHVIQGELGLTGVAADEAATTLSGSLGAMKASFQNLLANIATGGDVEGALGTLIDNAVAFVSNNLVPMASNILGALPEAINGIVQGAIRILNSVLNGNPDILQSGVQLVLDIGESIISNLPYLLEAVINLAQYIGDAIINTDWMSVAKNFAVQLQSDMNLGLAECFGVDDPIGLFNQLVSSITEGLPKLLDSAVEIINAIVDGILNNLPSLISTAGELLNTFVSALYDLYPTILESGMQILMNLVDGIVTNLPEIVTSAIEIISNLTKTILTHLPEILESGIKIIGELVAGLIQAIPKIIAAVPEIISAIWDTITQTDWIGLGKNVIDGIVSGLKSAASSVWQAIKDICADAFQSAKDFFGIASPSKLMRDQVGKWIPEGMAIGIENNIGSVSDAMQELSDEATADINGNLTSVIDVQRTNSSNMRKTTVSGANLGSNGGVQAIVDALSKVSVIMDGRTVGTLVATPVNNELGRMSLRRV